MDTLKQTISRRQWLEGVLLSSACWITPTSVFATNYDEQTGPQSLKVEQLPPILGRKDSDWTQARTAFIPGKPSRLITTMSLTGKIGSHKYFDIYQTISKDEGKTWSKPEVIPSLKRTKMEDGYEVAAGDLWPTWHAKSQKVIATGKTFNFEKGHREERLREKVSYAYMDPKTETWSKLKTVKLPSKDRAGKKILAPNSGTCQRWDLKNGEILLPIRYQSSRTSFQYTSIITRCRFDGETLHYLGHGTEHTIPRDRGLYEPSLIRFKDRFFLTLRADHSSFVTRSDDGTNYIPQREWKYDDGGDVGSYNTQQHWMVVGGRLFLMYTRKGAKNDHIFRHRAPLFFCQVDPDRLVLLRKTEQIALPQNHASLGNWGVCSIDENRSFVTCGEGFVSYGKRKGQRNKVLHAEIRA